MALSSTQQRPNLPDDQYPKRPSSWDENQQKKLSLSNKLNALTPCGFETSPDQELEQLAKLVELAKVMEFPQKDLVALEELVKVGSDPAMTTKAFTEALEILQVRMKAMRASEEKVRRERESQATVAAQRRTGAEAKAAELARATARKKRNLLWAAGAGTVLVTTALYFVFR